MPLKDMLGKKFETVGELLRDTQPLVADEHVRLERAGAQIMTNITVRVRFLILLSRSAKPCSKYEAPYIRL